MFFRKDALRKYYGDDLYKIEDGYLRCAGIWGLRLDNDLPDPVMVYLGDLGRDIPPEEARYWRSYNVPPLESGRSETNFRRSILGQFADPKSVELLLRRAYRATSSAWEKRFGYPLFRELHEDDRHILDRLHVPLGDSQGEFDEQIGYLAKLVVDYLNEAAITDVVGKGERDERGLRKLERLLEGLGAPDVKALVQPLAAVQGLRSRGAAHAKGTGYDLAIAIGDLPRRQGFENLLTGVMDTLEVLQNVAGGADES